MTRYVYIAVLVAALLVLAVGGWTVRGVRRALSGSRRSHRAGLAPSV